MERTDYETICALALNKIMGYVPRAARTLVARFGSPGAVFSQDSRTLDLTFGPFNQHRPLINERALEDAEAELHALRERGCRFISMQHPAFPRLLQDCPDAPVGLYVRSESPLEQIRWDENAVAVVGTRDISPYGRRWTAELVRGLGRCTPAPAIVSGLAIGVDFVAHATALDAGLPTIAVIPVGIFDVYPVRHTEIARRIASTPGCALVTDFPPDTPAVPFNFLRRNRIIAGLSRATVLAESKSKGGGTLTARLASSYGREVFAIPGRVDDVRSSGCNRLISEGVAEALTDPGHFGERLGMRGGEAAMPLEKRLEACYAHADPLTAGRVAAIARIVRARTGITSEEICRELGMEIGDVSAALCLLESDGFIRTDLLGRCCIDDKKL